MIKILVDSTCDIEAQEAVDLGLHVIPLTYHISKTNGSSTASPAKKSHSSFNTPLN